MPVEKGEFRHALGHLAAGVTVVTTQSEGQKLGITVTSFCSLSLVPPQVLICIDKHAPIYPHLRVGGSYAVNFLTEAQEAVSRGFATRGPDPFEDLDTSAGQLAAPIITSALAAVECGIVATHDAGDHTIFVGQVEATWIGDGMPLLYYRGQYGKVDR